MCTCMKLKFSYEYQVSIRLQPLYFGYFKLNFRNMIQNSSFRMGLNEFQKTGGLKTFFSINGSYSNLNVGDHNLKLFAPEYITRAIGFY